MENTATELYSELDSLTQASKEGACDFSVRAMDLRNKIVAASEDETSEIKYSKELVDSLLTRSVYTGLKDLGIRQEFRSDLEHNGATDEDLIIERRVKRSGTTGVTVHVNAAQQDSSAQESGSKDDTTLSTESPAAVAAEVKALRTEMAELMKLVTSGGPGKNFEQSDSIRGRGSTDGHVPRCWRCGKWGHIKRKCPSNEVPHDSGNGR